MIGMTITLLLQYIFAALLHSFAMGRNENKRFSYFFLSFVAYFS